VSGAGERVLRPRRQVEVRALAAGVSFLTRVPIGRWVALDGEDVALAGPAFPLIGACIGAAVGALADALSGPLPALLAAALALALGVLLTGALHIDALADSADALGAGSREWALEIMRDHAIGAYGAVAIVLDLLVRVAALSALAQAGRALPFAVAAGALSRSVPVPLAAALPYARPGEGLARSLTRPAIARPLVAALFGLGAAALTAGGDGLVLALCAALLALAFGLASRRWLGGVTGDVLGAAIETSEATLLVVAVALAGGR
jgi:adenosylcobinamide-GDP ribazoletransferase